MNDLIRLESAHLSIRSAWLNHPRVRAGVPISGEVTEESTRRWFARIRLDQLRADFVLLENDVTPRVMCGITGIDDAANRGELYMFSDPQAQGRGFGTAALHHLCKWAFVDRALDRLFLFTSGPNERARRFYEREGFVEEGRLRAHAVHHGRVVDRHIHGLLATEWKHHQGEGFPSG